MMRFTASESYSTSVSDVSANHITGNESASTWRSPVHRRPRQAARTRATLSRTGGGDVRTLGLEADGDVAAPEREFEVIRLTPSMDSESPVSCDCDSITSGEALVAGADADDGPIDLRVLRTDRR